MTEATAPSVRPAGLNDLPAIQQLLRAYPFKEAQRRAQQLDPERQCDFFLAGLRGAIERGAAHWLAEVDGRPVAFAGLLDDPWHSEIYQLPMAKIQPWIMLERASGPALLKMIADAAHAAGHRHLTARFDVEDMASLRLFEDARWRLVDVSLKLSVPLPAPLAPEPPPGWRVELATDADAGWIRDIGSRTHGATHYLNDPALAPDRTRALFDRWLERCLGGLAWRIYVLRDPTGAGRGFVTYLRNQSFARALGRRPLILDFVLIEPGLRGEGLGRLLVAESLAREATEGFDYCELRTSAHNIPAVAAYERLGLRLCAGDYVVSRLD